MQFNKLEPTPASVLKVFPARPGEFNPLEIGDYKIWPPVVLAPMAGITNAPFRRICRRFGDGLFISEMITARLFLEGDKRTLQLAGFAPDESPRSIQLYGVDPDTLGRAVRKIVSEDLADHIDLNFGCPVRKITRKGGGAAIPPRQKLFAKLIRSAVKHAGALPVTVKFRMGIDDQRLSYLSAGTIAESEGAAAVTLHARTAAQLYSGKARWEAIAELKQQVRRIPVLGNGDIWHASQALEMMRQTRCDGVVIGRGCLGRPWLFRDLACLFEGLTLPPPPTLKETLQIMNEHARSLCRWMPESGAIKTFRKHARWYVQGYPGEAYLTPLLQGIECFDDLLKIVASVKDDQFLPKEALFQPRGKQSAIQKVSLPHNYEQSLLDDRPPGAAAEAVSSGG